MPSFPLLACTTVSVEAKSFAFFVFVCFISIVTLFGKSTNKSPWQFIHEQDDCTLLGHFIRIKSLYIHPLSMATDAITVIYLVLP